jgi:hypothetical protein
MQHDTSKLIYQVFQLTSLIQFPRHLTAPKLLVWRLRTCLIGPTVLPEHCLLSSSLNQIYSARWQHSNLHNHGMNFTLLEPQLISDNVTHYAVK